MSDWIAIGAVWLVVCGTAASQVLLCLGVRERLVTECVSATPGGHHSFRLCNPDTRTVRDRLGTNDKSRHTLSTGPFQGPCHPLETWSEVLSTPPTRLQPNFNHKQQTRCIELNGGGIATAYIRGERG